MDFDPSFLLPTEEGEALQTFLLLEKTRVVAEGYEASQEVILRKIALRLILEASKCDNFDASVPYIAMNYFDRYISRHPVPHLAGSFRVDLYLFAICCLMVAWKLRYKPFKVQIFLAQNDLKHFENPLLKAEVEILNGLNWNMRPITALCFVDLIIKRIPDANGISRRFINEIIIQTQGDVTYTKFRPSLIAASAILSACRVQYVIRYNRCRGGILALGFVNADDLDTCTNKISAMCIRKRITVHGHVNLEAGESSQVRAGTSQAGQSSQEGETSQAGQGCQVGETSEAGPCSQEGETYEAGRTSVFGETSEEMLTFLFGEEAAASEGGQISEEEETPIIVMATRRPGKEPIEETSASELTRQRAVRRERVQEITEIQELQDPGSLDSEDMNFDLKWLLWNTHNPEDLFIDSARFRPGANPASGAESQDQADSTEIEQRCTNCNVM